MEIQRASHGAVTVVIPKGSVAEDDADVLRQELIKTRAESLGRLVVDLSAVPFLDSLALDVLLDVTEDMARSGHALKLCDVTDVVREVLELTDIASALEIFDDVNSAVRSFL
jgi:anti-sigma B factor antagonist